MQALVPIKVGTHQGGVTPSASIRADQGRHLPEHVPASADRQRTSTASLLASVRIGNGRCWRSHCARSRGLSGREYR